MPIIDLSPLDSEGLRLDRPSHETKWRKLTNVAFRDGSLIPRAGFKEAYDYSYQVVAAGVEPAPANGLVELRNPGSSITGRGGGAWVSEILRPDNSSSLVAGWSASATTMHGDIDEAVPDGDNIVSSTMGSQASFTFSNPSATYTDILGVRVYVRARVNYTGTNDSRAIITLYQRSGVLNVEVAEFEVWAYDVDETAFWYDYSFLLEKNYIDGHAWDDADLDGLTLVLEFTEGTSGAVYYLSPQTIDSNTGWTDAADGGSASVTDVTLAGEDEPAALPGTGFPPAVYLSPASGNGLSADNANDVIEFSYATIPGGVTFDSIDWVQVDFRVQTEPYQPCAYEIYYNNGSVDTLISSAGDYANADCRNYSSPAFVKMTTNPVSSAAWTQAEVDAASFKLKLLDNVPLTLEWTQVTVSGTVEGASVLVDTLSAEVLAPGTTSPPDKLVLSNRSFLRLQPEDLTIDDVTNSTPSTSCPSIMPFDWAVLYGQVYVVNGTDPTKRYPTAGSVFESLATNNADGATPLTGRTVCAFADRILYGWVRDNTTYTPERVAYSQQFNGGVHNHVSAGDFDIIDSMGGIVALRTLNESLCFAGKERGVYALRRTGNIAAPIIVDPIDYETGCLSMYSAVRVLLKGQPVIMFLGDNPTAGLNVFAFDGTSVRAVGDAINPLLEELANPRMNSVAVAGVDPRTSSYVLFVSPGRDLDRSVAFSMNLNSLSWTRWDLPYSIYSAAQFSFQPETALISIVGSTNLGGEAFAGIPTMVLGGRNNLPLRSHDLPFDTLTVRQSLDDQPGFTLASDPRPQQKNVFTSTIETGDIQLLSATDGEMQLASYRLHLDSVNYGPVRIAYSSSIDGGLTFSDETIRFIGDISKDGSVQHTLLDFENPVNDRRVRFRIRILPADSTWELPFFWQIDRIYIDYSLGGTDGP